MSTYLLGRLSVADLGTASRLEAAIESRLHAEEFFRHKAPSPNGLARVFSRIRRAIKLDHGYGLDVLVRGNSDSEGHVREQLQYATSAIPEASMLSVQPIKTLEWCFDLVHPYSEERLQEFWDHMATTGSSYGYVWAHKGLQTPEDNEEGVYALRCRIEGYVEQVLKERQHVYRLTYDSFWKGVDVEKQEFSFPDIDVLALVQSAAIK